MGHINPTIPELDEPNATADPKVRNALIAIRNEINGKLNSDNWEAGSIEAANFSDGLAGLLGINNGTVDGRGYEEVATSQSTSSASFVDLSTAGPSVTVDVPSNGVVLAYIEADLTPSANGVAVVGLYEATDHATPLTVLIQAVGSSATRRSLPGSTAGTTEAGGFLAIPATAGARTYTLKYVRVGGSGSVTFANRKLWVITGGA